MKQLFDRDTFLAERLRVVRALDPALFRQYLIRQGTPPPPPGEDGDYLCLVSLHKARTAMRDLPMPERTASKRWLLALGYSAMDDGVVPV